MLVGLLQQGTNIAVILEYNSKHNSIVKYTLRCNYEGIPLRRLNSVLFSRQYMPNNTDDLPPWLLFVYFNNALQCIQFKW